VSSELELPGPHMNRLLVFVAPSSGIRETASGLAVVAGQSEAPLVGHVLGIGPDVNPTYLMKGNRVLFSRYAGIVTEIGGKEYHVIEETDVQLVWRKQFELPDALQADLPCTCRHDATEPCKSKLCVNREQPVSALMDDLTGSELVNL
jgi:co-chaperonin GroES (HSP10)